LDLGFGVFFGINQLFALVLGSKRDLLPQQLLDQIVANHSSIFHLQFSDSSLSPICSTLQQLALSSTSFYNLNEQTFVFLLRHFPKLQKYQVGLLSSILKPLQLLHEQNQQQQLNIRNLTPPATSQVSSEELGLVLQWTVNSPFQGNC
jgi:hypothetical protein